MKSIDRLFEVFDELFERFDRAMDEVFGDFPSFEDTCKHFWKPAKYNSSGARHCLACERTELLTDPEFYAMFGSRLFHIMKGKR